MSAKACSTQLSEFCSHTTRGDLHAHQPLSLVQAPVIQQEVYFPCSLQFTFANGAPLRPGSKYPRTGGLAYAIGQSKAGGLPKPCPQHLGGQFTPVLPCDRQLSTCCPWCPASLGVPLLVPRVMFPGGHGLRTAPLSVV